MARSKWLTKKKFNALKAGKKVTILYRIGEAQVVSDPYEEKGKLNELCVNVKFSSGPWSGKTIPFPRKQISSTKESFPALAKPIYKK